MKVCPNCNSVFTARLNKEPKYCSAKCWYGSKKFKNLVKVINTGKVYSEKTKNKIRETLIKKGIRPPLTFGRAPWNKGKHHIACTGENSPTWKGEKAGYGTKHGWVYRWFGKPKKCEECGTRKKIMYHWANISGKYLRKKEDWKRLCVPCHRKMDGLVEKLKINGANQYGYYNKKK